MKTKLFLTCIACFIFTSVFSQANLNDYKYVIVPNKFDFLKSKNQYRLNDLTKFLFEKKGFKTVMEGSQYPEDLANNVCLGLNSNVEKEKGVFKTKLFVVLKDCKGKEIYKSQMGESRIKEYNKAYNEALRGAFKSFETIKYKPNNKNTIVRKSAETKNQVSEEIQKLKEEIQSLKKKKEEVIEVVETKAKVEEIVEVPVKETITVQETVIEGASNILYAQETDNGFQLVDSSPKVIYRIKSTNLNNVFLVEDKSAILYKKGDDWFIEYYSSGILEQETLNIKF